MTKTHTISLIHIKSAALLFLLFSFAFYLFPASVHASTFAYVSTTGEVKSVIATDWMSAISLALDIHQNSGVVQLLTQADISEVVGAVVKSVQ